MPVLFSDLRFLVCTGWIYSIAMVSRQSDAMPQVAPSQSFLTGFHCNIREFKVTRFHSTTYGSLTDELFSTALYIASLAEVGTGRTVTRPEIAAIAWAVNISSGILNTVGTKAIGKMSTFYVWWTVGGTVVLVVTLLAASPEKVSQMIFHVIVQLTHWTSQNTAKFVFTDYEKYVCIRAAFGRSNLYLCSFTGWSNRGFVVLLGFLQVSTVK